MLPEAIAHPAAKDRQADPRPAAHGGRGDLSSVRRGPAGPGGRALPGHGSGDPESHLEHARRRCSSPSTRRSSRASPRRGSSGGSRRGGPGSRLPKSILLRTLVYRVEQVFLIHRKTGLLLQHVSATAAGVQDADMISGMLTAIRDFVHDSFGGKEGDWLDTFQVGEFTVWVEQGPQAVLAAVIRGNAAAGAARCLHGSDREDSPRPARASFEAFEGDAAPFERSRAHLEACLKAQRQTRSGRRARRKGRRGHGSCSLRSLGAARPPRSLGVLRRAAEPAVGRLPRRARRAAWHRRDGGRQKRREVLREGLRDPLAADPATMLAPAKLRPEGGRELEALSGARPGARRRERARYVLEAPATVTLRVQDGALFAAGVGAAPVDRGGEGAVAGDPGRGAVRRSRAGRHGRRGRLEAARGEGSRARLILFARGSAELPPAETAKLRDTARTSRSSRVSPRSRRPPDGDPRRDDRARRQQGD